MSLAANAWPLPWTRKRFLACRRLWCPTLLARRFESCLFEFDRKQDARVFAGTIAAGAALRCVGSGSEDAGDPG